MRKGLLMFLGVAFLVSSCSGGAAGGAYAGGQFGYIIGSSIGGIAGGWRGHHTGALIGTIGGMVAGAAIGDAVENAERSKYEKRADRNYPPRRSDNDIYDPQGRGDDRIMITPQEAPLEIRNAMITETMRDGVLTRGEECSVVFEIFNLSDESVYDVRPLVEDVTGNKHISISTNLNIESIGPHKGVRYTASILADKRLKDGEIKVRVGVAQGKHVVKSQTRVFTVPTAKNPR